MFGIRKLTDLYKEKGEEFIQNLLDCYLIINEQTNGSFFSVKLNKENNNFQYYKKDGPISYIDRILTKYYNKAIEHFEKIPSEIKFKIPESYEFCMEYFHDDKKTNLILSYIKENNNFIQDKKILDKWAEILNVEPPHIIFQGKLDEEQKIKIQNFIYTPFIQLTKRFKTQSFTKYILSILNVKLEKQYENQNIQGIIFRFYDNEDYINTKSSIVAKIIDPVFEYMLKQNKEKKTGHPNDYMYLIIIDLMNFIEIYKIKELRSIIDKNISFEENYVKLINKIYIDFIDEYKFKYLDVQLKLPAFLDKEFFDINIILIDNDKVKELIEFNKTFKEIYKIFLNFFRKKKKNAYGLFTKNLVLQFNGLIDKIRYIIIGNSIYENYFPSFEEFNNNLSDDFEFIHSIGIKEKYKQYKNSKKVNIIIDYFQPVQLEHIKSAQLLKKKNKYPVIFLIIEALNKTETYPFSYDLIKKMLNSIKSEHPNLIIDVISIKNDNIENIINSLYPNYQPIFWGTSKSKLDDYVLQLDFAKNKDIKYNLSNKFKLVELPLSNINKKILGYIQVENFKAFKELTPKSIHSEFFNLKNEIKQLVNFE